MAKVVNSWLSGGNPSVRDTSGKAPSREPVRTPFPVVPSSIRIGWLSGDPRRLGVTLSLVLLLVGHSLAAAQSNDEPYSRFVAGTDPLSPRDQQKKFHLPPGFEIQLVAAEPEIRKPINLSFGAKSRLLVTGSVEYPHAVASGQTAHDAIWSLEDTDRNVFFDRVKTIASGLNILVGITPVSRGVLAYSVPTVDRFMDLNGDGRALRREVVYRGFGSEDTHGMPNGFVCWIDGWVYACHGEGKLAGTASPQPELRSFAIDVLGAVGGEAALEILDRFLGDLSEPVEIRTKAAESPSVASRRFLPCLPTQPRELPSRTSATSSHSC